MAAERKAEAKRLEAQRYRVCGAELAAWQRCIDHSHAAVMARYKVEGRTDNKPRTLAAIRIQVRLTGTLPPWLEQPCGAGVLSTDVE